MKTFDAASFTATEWTSAEAKAKLANQFVKFAEADFPRSKFTKSLYRDLTFMFGHIAHYDIEGFFGTWFSNDQQKKGFVENALRHPAYGDPHFTFSDVEKALKAWMSEAGLWKKYADKVDTAVEAYERAELARLKAKYEK